MSAPEVVLDSSALRGNFRALQKAFGGRPLFPVVKADAYGHGAVEISRQLEADFDARAMPYLCVARVGEAKKLRQAGVKRAILVLSHFEAADLDAEFPADTELALSSAADVKRLAALTAEARARVRGVHVEFDTGINRVGFALKEAAADARAFLPLFDELRKLGLRVNGLMTHLARGEDLPSLGSAEQMTRFETFLRRLRVGWSERAHGEFPAWIHAANSSGLARDLGTSFATAARPGIHLWGLWADEKDRERSRPLAVASLLRPVMRVRAPFRQLFVVKKGEGVGYGHRYSAPEEVLLGTVNLGYADGVSRSLSRSADAPWKVGYVVEGARVPFAGTVSMDLTTVDLSKHPKAAGWTAAVKAGTPPELVAEWIGPGQGAEEIASALGTISYEVVCAVTTRVARRVE
jgi:alanine racemase